MIGLPTGTKIWLASGITDMQAGTNGLAAKVETALAEAPYYGHVSVFRGRCGDMPKVLWWSGAGLCCWQSDSSEAASSGYRRIAVPGSSSAAVLATQWRTGLHDLPNDPAHLPKQPELRYAGFRIRIAHPVFMAK